MYVKLKILKHQIKTKDKFIKIYIIYKDISDRQNEFVPNSIRSIKMLEIYFFISRLEISKLQITQNSYTIAAA
jgi:hypothetical protein